MSLSNDWFVPMEPSHQVTLLQQMVGQTLTKLIRYSLSPAEAWMQPDPEWDRDEPLEPHEVFSLAAGPLMIGTASGLEIAFGASEHCEIILDAQRLSNGQRGDYQFREDPEYFAVDAANPRYCRPEIHRMLGKRIREVTLLRMDGRYYEKSRSFETGLVFYVEDCPELVVSASLTRGLDDFAVTLRDEILPEYWQYLSEERLLPARR